MPRFVAFLRAINVGGHIVKMEQLRRSFEVLGLTGVETFIASGNVIFDGGRHGEETLRKRIERRLEEDLGYAVPTFLRSEAQLQRIAEFEPFAPSKFRTPESRLFIAFLAAELRADAEQALLQLATATDEFRVHGRDVYWLCHVRSTESEFSGAKLEKAVRAATTLRNINTVKRLAAKLARG